MSNIVVRTSRPNPHAGRPTQWALTGVEPKTIESEYRSGDNDTELVAIVGAVQDFMARRGLTRFEVEEVAS